MTTPNESSKAPPLGFEKIFSWLDTGKMSHLELFLILENFSNHAEDLGSRVDKATKSISILDEDSQNKIALYMLALVENEKTHGVGDKIIKQAIGEFDTREIQLIQLSKQKTEDEKTRASSASKSVTTHINDVKNKKDAKSKLKTAGRAIKCDCVNLACGFIEKLSNRSHAFVDLSKNTEWLDGAYTASAGQGNPAGSVLIISAPAKVQIEKIVCNFFESLAYEVFCGQSRFDCLFRNATRQIEDSVTIYSPNTAFSFGRAQKILNIIVKYCYVWHLCKKTHSPMFGDVSWINKWEHYLHVPVDNLTIDHLTKTHRPLVCPGKTIISWKWKMNEYCYLGIQDAIRELAYADELSPMCYEIKNIWL